MEERNEKLALNKRKQVRPGGRARACACVCALFYCVRECATLLCNVLCVWVCDVTSTVHACVRAWSAPHCRCWSVARAPAPIWRLLAAIDRPTDRGRRRRFILQFVVCLARARPWLHTCVRSFVRACACSLLQAVGQHAGIASSSEQQHGNL